MLAFPQDMAPAGAGPLLGDVAISAETAERQAQEVGHGVAEELDLLLTHGILHLTGWNDETPARRRRMMRRAETLLGWPQAGPASPPRARKALSTMRSRHLLDSARFAVDGLVHVLHKDWHMRVLLLIGALLLLASAIVRVTRVELLLLCVAITLVVMAEVLNSAIESVVDLVSPEYHPLAKVAKDVGGAGVLVATIMGILIVIGVFVNADAIEALRGVSLRDPPHPVHILLVGITTVFVAVILGKLWGGTGTLTRGGIISAHSALAFFCFVSIWFLTPRLVERLLAFVLAILVAQSRVDAGIHTVREVLIGAVAALVIGFALYGALVMRAGALSHARSRRDEGFRHRLAADGVRPVRLRRDQLPGPRPAPGAAPVRGPRRRHHRPARLPARRHPRDHPRHDHRRELRHRGHRRRPCHQPRAAGVDGYRGGRSPGDGVL